MLIHSAVPTVIAAMDLIGNLLRINWNCLAFYITSFPYFITVCSMESSGFFVAVLLVVSSTAIQFGSADLEEAWEKYLVEFPLGIQTKAEYGKRKSNFAVTNAMIEEHNSNKDATYRMEHNKFSAMDDEEMIQFTGAILPSESSSRNGNLDLLFPITRQLPTSIDYRTHKCMQPVKSQGGCGSCWAFSATSVVEFGKCIVNGTKVALSEQQMVDCDKSNKGCGGGYMDNAWRYLAKAVGQSASATYPYAGVKGTCRYKEASMKKAIVSLTNPVMDVPRNDTKTMMMLLANNQLLSVGIAVVRSFKNYRSGVYVEPNCQSGIISYHAITVVGYGTLNGVDYWVIRNSWGTGWGARGYALFQRGKNLCLIESYATTTNVVG
ncbi:zingipain-2-like isoform X2 [Daphnia pulex]|uniref:zingipain-2-like isoform X2 n=1 Tax=Daphnia pulex TaxID=6669 RepID=UPI001EE01AB3|nr:zingipain-2-like isoform X2 [Daphnia pulex]